MIGKDLRIVFMGTPEFAVPSLRALVEQGYNVVGVVTVPDKPAGRGQKLHQSDVKLEALRLGLPVFQPEKLKSEEFVAQMQALNVDLSIVIAFRMLPEVIWAMPKFGTFNLHASLLPQYRGAAPINHAIINGDKKSGVTTFLLNHKIDEGAIIGQREVDIEPSDNVGSLYDKLMTIGVGLVVESVDRIAAGDIEPIAQDHIDPQTLRPAPKIFKDDCLIDWSWSAERIVNFVRGLSPYPAAWCKLEHETKGETTAKIFAVRVLADDAKRVVGSVYSDGRTTITVKCADGVIAIDEIQLAGKRRLSVKELLLGMRDINDYKAI